MKRLPVSVLLIVLLLTLSCNRKVTHDDDDDTNRAPVISSVYPNSTLTSTATTLHCSASDADGDSLTYLWTTASGSFSSSVNSDTVIWIPPSTARTCTVTITVTDGYLSDTERHAITVTGASVPTSYVSGYVSDVSTNRLNVFIESAEVCIDTFCTTTNSSGFFGISRIEYGTYTLSVTAEGYFDHAETLVVDEPSETRYIRLSSTVTNCGFEIDPTALSFGDLLDSLDFEMMNTGETPLSWTISSSQPWATVSTVSGSMEPGDTTGVTVSVDRTGLAENSYTAVLTIAADACTTRYMTVQMSVTSEPGTPVLLVQPQFIDLAPLEGDARLVVRNAGTGSFYWCCAANQPWISFDPSCGYVESDRDTISLTFSREGLSAGTHTGRIIISSVTAGVDTVDVSMEVAAPGTFTVTPDTLDFGTSLATLQLSLTNDLSTIVIWASAASDLWISTPSGSVAPAGGNIANVTIDRESMPPGVNIGRLYISTSVGTIDTITIIAENAVSDTLTISTDTLDFGSSETELPLTLTNNISTSTSWFSTISDAWIDMSPTTGSVPGLSDLTLTATIDRSGLSYGSYVGYINIIASYAEDYTIVVLCNVGSGTDEDFAIFPDTLDFGDASTSERLYMENNTHFSLFWYGAALESWIDMGSTSGSIPSSTIEYVDIELNRDDISSGINYGSLYIYSSGVTGDTIVVRAEGPAEPPAFLDATPESLMFGEVDSTMELVIYNPYSSSVTWYSDESEDWMSITPSSGMLPAGGYDTVQVEISRADLADDSTFWTYIYITSDEIGSDTVYAEMSTPWVPPIFLDATPESLLFGEVDSTMELVIFNPAIYPVTWYSDGSEDWLSMVPSLGMLAAEGSDTVDIAISRAGLPDDSTFRASIFITSDEIGGDTVYAEMTTPWVPPGEIDVHPDTLDFDEYIEILPFFIENVGDYPIEWTITEDEDWIVLSDASSTLALGETDTCYVTVIRNDLSPDTYEYDLTVTTDLAGADSVHIIMIVP